MVFTSKVIYCIKKAMWHEEEGEGKVRGCNEEEGKGEMLNFNARLKGIKFNILYLSAHFKSFNEKCKIV